MSEWQKHRLFPEKAALCLVLLSPGAHELLKAAKKLHCVLTKRRACHLGGQAGTTEGARI